MTEILRERGNASSVAVIMSGGVAQHVKMGSCFFTSCSVRENQKGGGAITTQIVRGTVHWLRDCCFSSCTALSDRNGKEGGLLMELDIDDADFNITSPPF
jgi:hypothetical protein